MMTKREEDEAYLEGKARGFGEGYAKASDHFFKLGLFIVVSLVLFTSSTGLPDALKYSGGLIDQVRTGDLEEVCAQTCAHFVPTLVRKSFIYVVGCHLMPLVTC